jgi:hypothetical protein
MASTFTGTFLNLESGALGIVDDPECNRVDIHWDRVLREARFRPEVRGPDPLVDVVGNPVDDGDHEEHPRSTQTPVATEAEHDGLFPLIRELDRRTDEPAHARRQRAHDGNPDGRSEQGERSSEADDAPCRPEAGNQGGGGISSVVGRLMARARPPLVAARGTTRSSHRQVLIAHDSPLLQRRTRLP